MQAIETQIWNRTRMKRSSVLFLPFTLDTFPLLRISGRRTLARSRSSYSGLTRMAYGEAFGPLKCVVDVDEYIKLIEALLPFGVFGGAVPFPSMFYDTDRLRAQFGPSLLQRPRISVSPAFVRPCRAAVAVRPIVFRGNIHSTLHQQLHHCFISPRPNPAMSTLHYPSQ